MSKKQIREHKQENQIRKASILKQADSHGKRNGIWYLGGVIQDGKYTGKSRVFA